MEVLLTLRKSPFADESKQSRALWNQQRKLRARGTVDARGYSPSAWSCSHISCVLLGHGRDKSLSLSVPQLLIE